MVVLLADYSSTTHEIQPMESQRVGTLELIHHAASRLDSRALALVVLSLEELTRPALVDAATNASRSRKRQLLAFISKADLWNKFQDSEFVEALGDMLPSSHSLARLAFATAERPSEALNDLAGMADAGALDFNSERVIGQLLHGTRTWVVEAQAGLFAALLSNLDTFAELGEFLQRFTSHRACDMPADRLDELLELLMTNENLRDLGGEPSDLFRLLPEYERALMTGLQRDTEEDDSEVDEEGNLAGFVVDTDGDECTASSDGSTSSRDESVKHRRNNVHLATKPSVAGIKRSRSRIDSEDVSYVEPTKKRAAVTSHPPSGIRRFIDDSATTERKPSRLVKQKASKASKR